MKMRERKPHPDCVRESRTESCLVIYRWLIDPAHLSAQLHFADVHVIAGSWQQRFEHERFGTAGAKLSIAIDTHVADAGFGAACWSIEELLRIGNGRHGMSVPIEQAFSSVGTNELGPVTSEEVGVGENV